MPLRGECARERCLHGDVGPPALIFGQLRLVNAIGDSAPALHFVFFLDHVSDLIFAHAVLVDVELNGSSRALQHVRVACLAGTVHCAPRYPS